MTDTEIVDAIRFHEATLNQLFEAAAARRLKVTIEGTQSTSAFTFRPWRVEGDEWKDEETPPMEPCRMRVVVERAL